MFRQSIAVLENQVESLKLENDQLRVSYLNLVKQNQQQTEYSDELPSTQRENGPESAPAQQQSRNTAESAPI